MIKGEGYEVVKRECRERKEVLLLNRTGKIVILVGIVRNGPTAIT